MNIIRYNIATHWLSGKLMMVDNFEWTQKILSKRRRINQYTISIKERTLIPMKKLRLLAIWTMNPEYVNLLPFSYFGTTSLSKSTCTTPMSFSNARFTTCCDLWVCIRSRVPKTVWMQLPFDLASTQRLTSSI